MSDRSKISRWRGYGLAILFGILYFCWLKLTGRGIPCLFRLRTGFLCPGCGITTMILCLLEGDLKGAWAANPFLFATWPFLMAQIAGYEFCAWRGKELPRWDQILLVLYTFFLCAFGVLRNLPLSR